MTLNVGHPVKFDMYMFVTILFFELYDPKHIRSYNNLKTDYGYRDFELTVQKV